MLAARPRGRGGQAARAGIHLHYSDDGVIKAFTLQCCPKELLLLQRYDSCPRSHLVDRGVLQGSKM